MGTAAALTQAAELCRHFEGFRSNPYLCPAGYWTIGFGTVNKPDGTQVTADHPPISQETAEEWLMEELRNTYMAGVLKASPGLITHDGALAAVTDFAYNLGVPRYRASTLRRRINEQDWPAARVEINRWVFGGGRKLPGLIRRRAAEAKLIAD